MALELEIKEDPRGCEHLVCRVVDGHVMGRTTSLAAARSLRENLKRALGRARVEQTGMARRKVARMDGADPFEVSGYYERDRPGNSYHDWTVRDVRAPGGSPVIVIAVWSKARTGAYVTWVYTCEY